MEVEEQGQGEASYVTSGGSGGSVNVSLHPLVIMNISDHFTRVRMQQQQGEGRLPLGGLSLEYGLRGDCLSISHFSVRSSFGHSKGS